MQDLIPALSSFQAFIQVVLGFCFIVVVHELGHFLTAKWLGIKVTQFAVGFGPSIFSFRKGMGIRLGSTEPEYKARAIEQIKKNNPQHTTDAEPSAEAIDQAANEIGLSETEYRLNWVPLGGYVKMVGQEDMDPTAVSHDPRSFTSQPPWAKAVVLSAGVVMNLIFAALFFVGAFLIGVEMPAATVGAVADNSPAARAVVQGSDDPQLDGLRPGDSIIAINSSPISDFTEVAVRVALADPSEPMRVTVRRPNVAEPLVYQLKPEADPYTGLLSMGVERPLSTELLAKAPLPPALRNAGVQGGMNITHVDGQPIERYDQLVNAIIASRGEPVEVLFSQGKAGKKAAAQPVEVPLAAEPDFQRGAPESQFQNTPQLVGFVPATGIMFIGEQTPAATAGIEPGDVLARVENQPWPTIEQVVTLVRAAGSEPVTLEVLRDGQRVAIKPVIPQHGRLGIGLAESNLARISRVLPGSPAAALDQPPPGSQIVAVNSQPVQTWSDVQRQLQLFAQNNPQGGAVEVEFVPNLANASPVTASLQLDPEQVSQVASLGWRPPQFFGPGSFEIHRVAIGTHNPIEAAGLGLEKTRSFMLQTYVTLARLFQGSVKVEHLSGPVGIVDQGTRVAQEGVPYLLFFMGLLSVNLAVINFLPIPITDGGHILFLIIEKIKGSPVHPRVKTAAFYAGLALIACVFLMTLFNDVLRLFQS